MPVENAFEKETLTKNAKSIVGMDLEKVKHVIEEGFDRDRCKPNKDLRTERPKSQFPV